MENMTLLGIFKNQYRHSNPDGLLDHHGGLCPGTILGVFTRGKLERQCGRTD